MSRLLRVAVTASAVVGLVACFLPYLGKGDVSMSFWDLRVLHGTDQVVMVIVAYGVGLLAGLVGLSMAARRWPPILAALGFAFVLYKFRDGIAHLMDFGIGAKLMGIAAIAGLVLSLLAAATPDRQT